MKIRTVLFALFLLSVQSLSAQESSSTKPTQAQPSETIFRAGAATTNITPFLDMDIVGNFAPQPIGNNVHDELHVRCLALDDGKTKLAFAVVDNISMVREVWDEAKARIKEATGLPPENLMFSAIHTHSSVRVPAGAGSGNQLSDEYRALMISRIVDAVSMALGNLEPAEIAWGSGQLPQHVFNRRWLVKEGDSVLSPLGEPDYAVMNPSSALRPKLSEPAGPTNPQVYCLSVQTPEGRPIALLANYWLHYVGGVEREDFSADYFGEFCRIMEGKLGTDDTAVPPFVGILANGPCGDVNNVDRTGKSPAVTYKPYEKMHLVANDLANEVMRIREKMKYQSWVPLRAAAEELELGVRHPSAEQLAYAKAVLAKPEGEKPKHRLERHYALNAISMSKAEDTTTVFLQAFGIGDLGIPSIPFEVFTETGLQIRDQSPFPDTFTIELANGSGGYLPTPKQIDLGGYETWIGTNRVERDASEKIRDKVLDLLKKIR